MKNRLFNLCLLPLTAAFVIGCSQGGSSASGTPEASTTGGSKPPVAGKKLVVGFSQIGAESGWRTANTNSIKSEAEKRGIDLKFSDAQQKHENQIKAIRSFIDQKVDVIAFSPVVETGWLPVLTEAKKAGIPVFVSDRRPDVPDDMYVTLMGADFVKEGEMAGEWLVKKTGGKAVIAELEGTPGSAPAIDRKKGFDGVIEKNKAGMSIVFSQTGEFTRAKGKEVTEALLKSPQGASTNVIFAHNDDMALGAIQAVEATGKKPGKDIIILSIDGIKDAFQAMVDGKLNCTTECNPLLGPLLFDSIEKHMKGEKLEKRQIVPDGQYDETTAAKALPDRKY